MKKCFLSEDNRVKRLDFANEHVNFTPEYWNDVVFLDEKTFSTAEDGRRHVWRPREKPVDPKYVVQKKQSGRITLGFWGFISITGAGEIVEVGRHFNAAAYVDLLENILKPTVRATLLQEDYPVIRVVQDNSGVHRARVVQEWYNANPDFQKITWPAYAQDMNLIENLWSIMQKPWISGKLKNRDELTRKVHEVWQSVKEDKNICQRLIHSMPTRLSQVVKNKGYWTKY